ncbi:hypothetical protein M3Y95_01126100 [Aphelenchoides besseyi]|nr:hypothetical protein M3Y95_01126100 [Aphelenchoides besseyi]
MYCDLRCVHQSVRDLNDQCKDLYDPNNSTTSFVPKQLIPYYAQFPNYVEVVGHRLFDDVRLKDPRISIKNASFIGTTFRLSRSFMHVTIGLAPSTQRAYMGLIEQAYKQNLIPQPMISFSTDDNHASIMIMGDYDQDNCEQWQFFPSLYDDRWVFRLDSISIGGLNFSGHKNNGYKIYFNSFDQNTHIQLPDEIVDQMIQNNIVNETNADGLTTTLSDLSISFTINGHVYALPYTFLCLLISTRTHECVTIFKRAPPIRLTEEPSVSFSDYLLSSPICLAFQYDNMQIGIGVNKNIWL